ncbi:TIR-like domain-containing protein [Streptomyces sp. GB4-14]|uniref:TIR domain-containing protein n=1 Tax=Streptomyces sp. GB4-14 TaxID=2498703 RepID=UPI001F5EFFD8|nr:TIR-like domain-containing protein [Streptomyces sp. GB4-14]
MARRTFFSFHYERDVWRASNVRKSSQFIMGTESQWIDASLWEDAKLTGDAALKRLMDNAITGTSVTAVLIGAETYNRKWVRYEIQKSVEKGNGLFGIYVHNIRDQSGWRDNKGLNPLPSGYRTYDWVYDDGRNNLGSWVSLAYAER